MLKQIPDFIDADLLWVLAAMGHGDELAVVDRNFPAHSVALATRTGKRLGLPGLNAPDAVAGLLTLLPLDTFVDTPVWRMDPVDTPGVVLPVHADVRAACEAAEGRPVACGALERHAFYAAAARCFALVHTSEDRPYGCFILKKGVVFKP